MSDNSLKIIEVQTLSHSELIDITSRIADIVSSSGVVEGEVRVFVPHTTAAVTINENADPDVVNDMLLGLEDIVRNDLPYRHAEGNSAGHIKSSIVGVSETVFISGGRMVLGTWQGIYFCEFDGPRRRKVYVRVSI
jgi:secondary thiamine-phosphate synthase enzyme